MSIEDEKQKYASQIVNALSGSPAINKEQAVDVSIPESVNPAATIVQAINDTKPVPTIGLGSILGLPGQAKLQAKLEKNKPLVDTSTGVNVEDTGTAEQKIATTRTLGINGPYDIEQRTYGLDEESMAAASSGTNEGDLHVVNLRAGNAGLNISTDSTLNPADGSDGNPAFFNSKYPLLQTKVMPFKVKIPAYDLEVMSETLDPDKLAYQVATMVAGRPIPTYIGYTNAGFDLTESWYSGQIKGWMNAPLYLADIGVKGGVYVGTASNYATAWLDSVSNSIFGGKKKDDADKRLEQNLEGVVGITDDTVRGWNKIVNGYKDFLGTDLTEYAGFWTSLNEALPTAVAQMGAAYGINVLATGMGVSPQASRLLAAALSGATYGTAQGGDTFVGLQGAAVSPMRRMRNATISAGGSTLLNSLGYLTAFTSKVSAARYYSKEYVKRLWGAGAGAGIKGFFGEGLTEVGDQVLQDAMTYNMGDDIIAARLDNYTMAFLLGGITGLMGIGSAVSAERQQIYKEQIIAGKLGKDAIPAALALNDAVDKMSASGLFTREQAYDFIELMASPEGQRALKNRQGEILMGLMDKLDPKAIQYAKSLSATELQNAAKDFEMLDKTILKSLPATLDDSTKTMVSRAMSLIAPIISWYNNGNFKMPKFVLRDGSPMAYEPETNTIYINSKSSGKSIDLGLATDKKQPLIDPVQRGILHELGHMMDYQINRGTNFKEFMPTYFEAIAKAYGKERADAVQKSMNKKGDTFAFADSTDKADVREKQADKAAGRVNVKNTTENFAYAIGRLGKKVGKVLNMSESDAMQHVDAIMMMAAQLRIPSIQRQLNTYQKALTAMIKKNDATLQAMAKAQGNEELARHIRDFVAGDTNALSKEDILALYDILKTYTGVDGAKIIDDAFDGVNPETFTQRVEREFADSIKESETTVGQMQDAIAKKNAEAKQENTKKTKKGNNNIDENDLPNFEVNEQIAYASMRGAFEGEELDVDKHYAEGEALGTLGAGMRHGYGNNVLFDYLEDKKYYYDRWATPTLKHNQGNENIDTHRIFLALDQLNDAFPKQIKDVNTKQELKDKFQKQADSALKVGGVALEEGKQALKQKIDYIKEAMNITFTDSQLDDMYVVFSQQRAVDALDEGIKSALDISDNFYDENIRSTVHKFNDEIVEHIVWAEMYKDAIKSLNQMPEDFVVEKKQDNAEMHSFEVPDSEYLLNEDLPLEKQSQIVKDAIIAMAQENPDIVLFGGEYTLWDIGNALNDKENLFDFATYIDDEYVNELTGEIFRRALNDYYRYDEQGKTERVKFFENMVKDGKQLDGAIKTDAYRTTSLLLDKYGIKGIEFNGKRDGHGAVIFNGHTKHIERLHEDVFDVSEILNDKKKYVSNLEKRTNSKPTGKTYADDVKEVKGIIAKAGKPANWFTKMFANGDVNTALWSIGGKKLVDHFDLIGKMNRSSNASISYLEEFDGKLKKTMGFKNNVQRDAFENESSIKTIEVKQAVDPLTDENISVEISPLVAMNLYNTAKSKIGYQKVLRTFGGNEQEMNRVINSLTDEQKKYADAMMDYIKEKWDYYKKSYEQEGSEITEEPYWPIADAVHIALGDRKINSDIARKPDADGMISLDVDAREVFNHYIQRMSGAKENVYSTIQRIKDIFGYEKEAGNDQPTEDFVKLSDQMWNNSKKIRGMSQENIGGKDRYEKFLGLLDDFLAKREASLVGSESLNIAARNLTSGLLQWKSVQFMKNLANASGYWGLVPEGGQAKYWADTAWAATHPIEAAKYMFEKVPYLRNRFKGQNIDEALTQQTAGTDSLLMNWAKDTSRLSKEGQQIVSNVVALTQASRRLGFTPMLGGDMAANVIGGYGLLKQYETLYGDRAGDKLSEDIVMHQASNNQATRSLLQRQWSRDIRGELLRFGSEGVQKGKSMALAAAQAARGERSVGSATKEILSTMSSMILFALISAGVIDLFDSNDENDKEVYEALTREGISAIAGFSIIGNSIISPLVSIPLTGEMSTIGTPLTNILSSDLRKITKGDWESAVIHGIGSTVPVVGVDNLINEGRGVVRTFDEDERVRRSGLYMIGGRSQNYGEKRSGLK